MDFIFFKVYIVRIMFVRCLICLSDVEIVLVFILGSLDVIFVMFINGVKYFVLVFFDWLYDWIKIIVNEMVVKIGKWFVMRNCLYFCV